MTIYIDVYFLKNLVFNFLLLYLTVLLRKRKAKIYMIFLASLIGSIYAIIALYHPVIFNSLFLKLLMSIIMLVITFGFKDIKIILSSFFTIAYILSGIISSIVNIKTQIITFLFAVAVLIFFYLYEKNKKYEEYYEIEIKVLEDEINLIAKLDTGNELKDSMFGTSVIVVEESKIKEKVDKELIKVLNNEILEIPEKYKNKIKLISFKTISGEGIKVGIKLDEVCIERENEQIESKAIMVLSKHSFKKYDALIGKELIEGGIRNENISFNKT